MSIGFDTGWVSTSTMYLSCPTNIRCSGSASRVNYNVVRFSGSLQVSQTNTWNLNAIYAAVNGRTGWYRVVPYGNYRKDGSVDFYFDVSVGTAAGHITLENIFQVWNNAETGGVGNVAYIYCDAYYELGASAPTGIWGENLASETATDCQARSKVHYSSWGEGSGGGWWVISKISSRGSEWASSQTVDTMYWTGVYESGSQSSCAITTWYPEMINNNGLYTFGGAKYIASPSAPKTSATGSISSPSLTITGSVNYKGGDQNSSSCNNGTLRYWRFFYKKSSDSSYTAAETIYTTNTTNTFTAIPKETFALGTNYNIVSRARNSLGGCGSNYQTVYCPTGVSATVSENTPTSFTVVPSAIYAGDLASSTTGTMAQYVIKYSTDKTTVDNGGGTEMPAVVNPATSCTITGLTPGTTYYYRVYGWNILGLSQVSGTLSNTTVPRFYPESEPLALTAKNMGADVKIKIVQTGGLSENELPVTSLSLYRKPSSSSTWEQVGESITGLSLTAGQEYTFENAWTTAMPYSGDYNVRILMSNGTDYDFSPTYTITAPTSVSVSRYRETDDCPVQINANTSCASVNGIHHWKLSWDNGETAFKEASVTTTYAQLHSTNYLLYNTSYTYWSTAYDNFGCWTNSATATTKLDPRFNWFAIVNGIVKDATPIFAHGTPLGSTNYSFSDVYYVVKDSLGSKGLNVDLRKTRLTFITGTLNYRPESVASIKFTNNKTIAYKYVESADAYQFGLWNADGTASKIFHNGTEWLETSYDIPNTTGYKIAETNFTGKGLNSSAPFSTTGCSEVPMWENN